MRQQSGLTVTIHIFEFRAFRRDRIHLMPQLQVQIALKDLGHFQEGVEDSQMGRMMLGPRLHIAHGFEKGEPERPVMLLSLFVQLIHHARRITIGLRPVFGKIVHLDMGRHEFTLGEHNLAGIRNQDLRDILTGTMLSEYLSDT